jgi:hypothetical protein
MGIQNSTEIDRAIAALKLAAECGGELDRAEYKGACDGLVRIRDAVVAYDNRLNTTEISPTGDDYNNVMSTLGLHGEAVDQKGSISGLNEKSEGPKVTQTEAFIAQAVAVARFQNQGNNADAEEAGRLAKISQCEIGPHGEISKVLDATYVTHMYSENTGGGCMVDFIFMTDGRIITLNDEAIAVYPTKEAFYGDDDADNTAQHFMWITPGAATTAVALTHEQLVQNMKNEIVIAMDAGIIPRTVSSFSELHDYCDANCLGGLCKDEVFDALVEKFGGRDTHEGMPQGMLDLINAVQDEIGKWLAERAKAEKPSS